MFFLQMPKQAAFLGELFLAEDAAKLRLHVAFVPKVTRQAPLGVVSPITRATLKFATGIANLTAGGRAMTLQSISM